jgi:putative transposase
VPASTVQTLADRLDKALRRCIARRKPDKKRAGFPRFKTLNRWHSIQLRQYGTGRDAWIQDGRLRVPRKHGRSVKIKMHRSFEGTPKTVYLKLRAEGNWYSIIVCDLGDAPPKRDGEAIGLDVGLKVFLADSEGNTTENPKYHRCSKKKLAQRKTCRRKKCSKRRKKAVRQAAKLHLKTARQRKDFLHKVARRYVDRYGTIVIEDLNVEGMVKNHHLALSIYDASWSRFVEILEGKAGEAGSRVIKVPARFTTQACSGCGELVPKSLSIRTHACPSCGHVKDRNINVARNILLARTGPSERNATGCGERAPRSRLLL